MAQGPGGPGTGGSGTPDDLGPTTPAVPLDGGLSLILAAAGIGYAAKKVKDNFSDTSKDLK